MVAPTNHSADYVIDLDTSVAFTTAPVKGMRYVTNQVQLIYHDEPHLRCEKF